MPEVLMFMRICMGVTITLWEYAICWNCSDDYIVDELTVADISVHTAMLYCCCIFDDCCICCSVFLWNVTYIDMWHWRTVRLTLWQYIVHECFVYFVVHVLLLATLIHLYILSNDNEINFFHSSNLNLWHLASLPGCLLGDSRIEDFSVYVVKVCDFWNPNNTIFVCLEFIWITFEYFFFLFLWVDCCFFRYLAYKNGYAKYCCIDDVIRLRIDPVVTEGFHYMQNLLEELNFSISSSKLVHPNTEATCLGIIINAYHQTVSIPPENMQK